MKVCDAESHDRAPMSVWQEYVAPQYRPRAPRLISDEHSCERTIIDDKVLPRGRPRAEGIGIPGGMSDPVAARSTPYEKACPGG